MAPIAWFEPENEEFNLYIDEKETKDDSKFNKIKWKTNQLEMFEKLKEIKQNIWIQMYDVYLDKLSNVVGIGFRVTPEASFHHEYPHINFDEQGNIIGNLVDELKDMKNSKEGYKLVYKFYKTIIDIQKNQEQIS